jgi:16S rRNA (cytosine1402-N4)-methyltransferase
MSPLHIPVMLKEILNMFEPLKERSDLRYFDGTFGRGGHLRALMEAHPKITAVAMDRDLDAIDFGQKDFASWISAERLKLIHSNYTDFESQGLGLFDFMLLDLGVSSPQLDQGPRGFSFYHDGPLDMRMNQSEPQTAAEIVNNYTEDELVQLFTDLGEVSRPHRVVRAIVHDRKEKSFASTRDLAGLIERVDGWHRKGHHPATQYFLALRMEVNQELTGVEQALKPLVLGLKPKGRLAVLTFHSLEDRIVKNVFKSLEDLGRPVTKKVLQPEWSEAKTNSRARSAKLRVFERSESNEADIPTLSPS